MAATQIIVPVDSAEDEVKISFICGLSSEAAAVLGFQRSKHQNIFSELQLIKVTDRAHPSSFRSLCPGLQGHGGVEPAPAVSGQEVHQTVYHR